MNILRFRFFFYAVLATGFLIMLAASPALAQPRSIKGKVTDPDGNPIADASILIEATTAYRKLTTKTDKKGEYMYLLGLQSATYRIIVRKEGFQPTYIQNVKPEMGEELTRDFTLTPGEDYKLPFEMTDEERKEYMEKYEAQKKRSQYTAAVKEKFDLGVQLADQAKYEEALVQFNEALKIDPDQPFILGRAGDMYLKLEKNEEALACYQKALELNPGDPNMLTNTGIILSKMGRDEESKKYFMDAAAADPSGGGQAFYNLGVTMLNNGNTEGAAVAFKQCVERDPSFAEAYYQLGMCLAGDVKTFPDAVKALEKYVEIGKKPDQVETAKALIEALKK